MKKNSKNCKIGCQNIFILSLALLILYFPNILNAQSRAKSNSTASVNIINTYEIKKKSDVNVENIISNDKSGNLTLATNSKNGKTISDNSSTVTINEGVFTVTDTRNATYSVDLTSSKLLVYSGTENMTVDGLTCLTSKTLITGTEVIYLGATIHVNSNQANGIYSNLNNGLEVSVNYN